MTVQEEYETPYPNADLPKAALNTYDDSFEYHASLYDDLPYTRDNDVCSQEQLFFVPRRVFKECNYRLIKPRKI